jgi:hypothetical protein
MNAGKIISFIAIVFLITGCSQTKCVNKESEGIKSGIDTVSILFPHVEYSEKSSEAKNIKTGYSVFVSRKVADVLKSIIDESRFIAKSVTVICDSTIIDQWLPCCFSTSVEKYKHLNDSLSSSKETARTFPVIPDIQLLIEKVSTKYFLFVNGTAFGTTEETKRYDMLQAQTFNLLYDHPFTYDYQWSGLQLHVYLVETSSKEILWNNQNDSRDTKFNPIKEEEIKDLCRKLIQIN